MKAETSKKTQGEMVLDLPAAENAGSEKGTLQITETVLQILIKRAVLAIPGVTRFSGSSFMDNIVEIVRTKKIQDRSIQIQVEENRIAIEVAINLAFDFNPKDVADAVKEAVAKEIEALTGLQVDEVNVQIREMEDVPDTNSADLNMNPK